MPTRLLDKQSAQVVASGAATTSSSELRHQVGAKSELSQHQVAILESCRSGSTLVQLMKVVGRSDHTKFREGLVKLLIEANLLELTIPDKLQSRLQRYRTTEAGLVAMKGETTVQGLGRRGDGHA